jgi:dienelactone hydrolase
MPRPPSLVVDHTTARRREPEERIPMSYRQVTTRNWATRAQGFIAAALLTATAASAQSPTARDVVILSDGIRLAGNLWLPQGFDATTQRPGVLLVHGWGGEKSHLNQAYAPQIAARGYPVLTFDYRGWGESDGIILPVGPTPKSDAKPFTIEAREVRTIVNPLEQLRDIRAAVAFLQGEPGVDPDRLAIWGSSLGGGLALATAIEYPEFRVLMSQVGSVNPQAGFSDLPADNPLAPANLRAWRSAIARGDAPSFPGPESGAEGLRGYPFYPDFVRYDPMAGVERLRAATLIIDADREELFDIKVNGRLLFETIRNQTEAVYDTIEGTHYDVYRGAGYDKALGLEIEWLERHLPAPTVETARGS